MTPRTNPASVMSRSGKFIACGVGSEEDRMPERVDGLDTTTNRRIQEVEPLAKANRSAPEPECLPQRGAADEDKHRKTRIQYRMNCSMERTRRPAIL
jgi:hypothetical protein